MAAATITGMKRWALILLTACGGDTAETFEAEIAPVVRDEPPPQLPQPVQPVPPVQPVLTGFPCDVGAALQAACAGCHAGATRITAFRTRDDLLSLQARVGQRLASTTAPMPPRGSSRPLTADEQTLLESWVAQGMPAGECGALQ